ncbi:NB-ARC domain-containing protein [Streptomyces phytophilus]|uniref:NB-ARC domain-containing protein n=1 Tax=Streptomyces phytophilus TaxID=722715 RepID=UPI0015EFFF81|nr:NB-ARC domain-containing protein [Streptomyces phytophilus]
MRETEMAAALLSAMISSTPLERSPAGQVLHRLVHTHSEPHGQLLRQWEEACRTEAPHPALLQLSNSLARHATTDAAWRTGLENWLHHHPPEPQATANRIDGSAHLHGPTIQAGSIHGNVHFHHTDPTPIPTQQLVPRQLRPSPAHFTNRTKELHDLHRIADSRKVQEGPALAVVFGPGGVGKTALALRWLHETADHYPDGQLYADLTPAPAGEPAAPNSVLGGFLRALGVAGEHIPAEAEETAALFRSLTVNSRIAILLDNAATAGQVRALLPSSSSSTVVVTTRWRLGGLSMDGADFIPVTPLQQQAGTELLTRTVGERRTAAETDAVAGLVGLCAGLPIALSIAAARLVTRPQWPIARIVQELADEQRRLKALAMEEITVLSVFDLSYDGLPPQTARAYRWLGLHPGPDLSLNAAAAALQHSLEDTTALLENLIDASILEATGPDRYHFHDLVRLHARHRAQKEDSPHTRNAVIRRLLEHYLAFAAAAAQTVTPQERHLGPDRQPTQTSPVFATSQEALKALETELPNLMAAMRTGYEHRLDTLVWQLAEALWPLFLHHKHFPDWMATYQLGIDATTRCNDSAARARMHHHLGFAFHNLNRAKEALVQGKRSLAAAREAGHDETEAEAVGLLGMAHRSLGHLDDAIDMQQQAVALEHRAGRARGEALARRRLGQALSTAGRLDEAVDQLTRGRDLAESLSDHKVKAMTMVWLADALTRSGRADKAAAVARDAWSLLAESGSSQYQAQALMVWGEAAEALKEPATAHNLLIRSRASYLDVGASNLERVNRAIERVQAQLNDPSHPSSL